MSNFQKKLIKEYTQKGYTVLKTIRLNSNAYPDLLCMKLGEVDIWIESKELNDDLKPLQKLRIDQLNALGKRAFCMQDTKGIIYPLPQY